MTVKKLLLFLFISNQSFGQIKVSSSVDGSITITPMGIRGQTNQDFSLGSIALGTNALASNPVGYYNTAIGDSSLRFNYSGRFNSALGNKALYLNNSGDFNTSIGAYSMKENQFGSFNTAVGMNALRENRGGEANTAIGLSTLFNNLYGIYNVGIGASALFENTTGFGNVAIGVNTLVDEREGEENTAIGNHAGFGIINGSNNTLIGAHSSSTGDFSNATAIGAYSSINASNKVRIGNSAVTVIEGQVPWSNPSDRRLKENINYTSRLGLSFITRLQTVSYNYTADQNKTRHDGFIAQDVEKVMKDLGVPFSGLKKSGDGTYSLAYSDFVMPLVNAVKEQQLEIEKLKNQVADLEKLKEQNQVLLSSIEDIKAELVRMRASDAKIVGK